MMVEATKKRKTEKNDNSFFHFVVQLFFFFFSSKNNGKRQNKNDEIEKNVKNKKEKSYSTHTLIDTSIRGVLRFFDKFYNK